MLFTGIAEKSNNDYLDEYDPLASKYIKDMCCDEGNEELDHKYGVILDTLTEKNMIGNSKVDIIGSDLIVDNKPYLGTRALYELLFKKKPTGYTKQEGETYQEIVRKTNAARRYYRANQQVDVSKLGKYKKNIAPMVSGKVY